MAFGSSLDQNKKAVSYHSSAATHGPLPLKSNQIESNPCQHPTPTNTTVGWEKLRVYTYRSDGTLQYDTYDMPRILCRIMVDTAALTCPSTSRNLRPLRSPAIFPVGATTMSPVETRSPTKLPAIFKERPHSSSPLSCTHAHTRVRPLERLTHSTAVPTTNRQLRK